MKRLLFVLAFVLLAAVPSQAAIALVQHVNGSGNANANTQAVTVASTGSGNLLVAGIVIVVGGVTVHHVSGVAGGCSGAWTQATSAEGQVTSTVAGLVTSDVWYCLSASAGATTITMTQDFTATNEKNVEIWEVSGCTSCAFDLAAHVSDGTGAADMNGASVTTTGTSGFVAGVLAPNCCGITSNPKAGNEFTSGGDVSSTSGNGNVSLISSTAAAHQPVFSTTDSISGLYTASTAAFKGSGAGVTCAPTLSLLGVGRCG